MSFVLPGNARQLRFTGEAKAFVGDDTPGGGAPVALGKPRVRKATTVPPPPAVAQATPSMTPIPMATSRPRHVTGAPQSSTPASPGNRTNTPVPSSYAGRGPSIRAKAHSAVDEDMQTMALDRECHDVLPDGISGQGKALSPTRRPPPSAPGAAPIPGFRGGANATGAGPQVQMQTVLVPNADGSKPKGAPLALWLFAAVLAGILSYHVTPAIMGHFESPPAAKITPAI